MNTPQFVLSFAALCLAGLNSSFAAASAPLLRIDLESYDALTADAAAFAGAIGQDASILEAQLGGMLGPQLLGLIDPSKPWHAAVWMDSLGQPPLIAVALPVADFEAFEVAAQSSMLGMLGAQLLDLGDRVVLFGSSPGVPIADAWSEQVERYAADLVIAPTETLEIGVTLSDEIRQAAVGAMALPKAQMMTVFDDPTFETSGIPAETMKEMMHSYFSMYEAMLGDLQSLEYAMSVTATDLTSSLVLTPLAGSGSSTFLASQNVDITDISTSASWDSDMTMLMGMAAFPEEWQSDLLKLMKGLMPLYGLGDDVAVEWMDTMNLTLPFKGVYNIGFDEGISYAGFYEILEAPAAEVYDKWLAISEGAMAGDGSTPSYYSDISITKGYRSQAGHSVDLMELTLNPEHPTMKLPEQKALMDQMFKDGKMTYEMSLVGNRIYMGTEGKLNAAMAEVNNPAPIEINSNTRLAGSMNLISMMKSMSAGYADSDDGVDFSTLDAEGTQFSFSVEMGEGLSINSTTPLKLFKVFSEIE